MKTYWNQTRGVRPKRRRGSAVVEAAVVLPIVFLFFFGILEYGRYVMTLQVLTNAAREGSRYALAHTEPVTIDSTTYGNATSDVTNIVNDFSGGQKLTGQTIQVYASDSFGNNQGLWTDAGVEESICVRISGNYNFVVPQLLHLPSAIPVVAQAVTR
ncbi:MAG: TadE family protein, partial [Pirellulales bacterium]